MDNGLTIQEGRKFIAEFDPLMILDHSDPKSESWYRDNKWVHISHLKYHTSWGWLMPVVQRINAINLRGEYANNDLQRALIAADIQLVYAAVLQFIQWYTNQNK